METTDSSPRSERDLWKRHLAWTAAFLALRLVIALIVPISGDEAEYWDCSRHLDWSYLDHTPLLFWLMIPFRVLFGETRLGVRAVSLITSTIISLALPPLMKQFGKGHDAALRALFVLNATPLFFIGGLYEWTDILLFAFFIACVWSAAAIANGDRRGWWGFGLAIGFGFLAKIVIVLALGALLPVLALKRSRRDLLTAQPWLAAIVASGLTLPFWIWGSRHGWANITFQLGERQETHAVDIGSVIDFAIANVMLVTPFLFLPVLFAIFRATRESWARRTAAFAALLTIAVFVFVAFRARAGAHWAGPALILGCILAAAKPFRFWKPLTICAGITTLCVTVAAVFIGRYPEALMKYDIAYGRRPDRVSTKYLVFAVGNGEIAKEIQRRLRPDEMVASENYTHVHLLAFLSKGRLPTRLAWIKTKAVSGLPSLYWYTPEELEHRDFLFVTEKSGVDQRLREIFRSVEDDAPIVIHRDGRVVRTLRILRCRDLLEPDGVFTRLPRTARR